MKADKIWFSSDWHLDHKNILRFDNRPFTDIGHMNYEIVKAYNSVVGEKDTFFFLGDMCLGRDKVAEHALANMKGDKYFIKGNHDRSYMIKLYKKYGTYLGLADEITIDGKLIYLAHYPSRSWNKSHHDSFHLYGHEHYSLESEPWGRSMDVGIMTSYYLFNNWEPLNYAKQIKPILDSRKATSFGHHIEEK